MQQQRPRPSRNLELAELEALYDRVVPGAFLENTESVIESIVEDLDQDLSEPMRAALLEIVRGEQAFHRPNFAHLDLQQQVELKNRLRRWELRRLDGEAQARDFLERFFGALASQLPRTSDPSPFTIPLIYAIPDARQFIDEVICALFDAKFDYRDLFQGLSDQLYWNLCHASGIAPHSESKKELKRPTADNRSLEEVVHTYLRETPFEELFLSPVPLRFTNEDRFNHMHVLGGTGAGKTTLIENLILHDLQTDDPPSLVLIDPHSDLVRKLTHADLGIEDRLIIIDPRDTRHPPALNIFALNRERLGSYDEATREQVTAGVIQTFNYLFGGLTNLSLTGKQDVFFRYVARLMLSLPEAMGRNATILDMMKLMSDPTPYGEAIEKLPDIPREFFLKDFMSKTFEQTKEQIRYRLQAIIENPTMARLFTSPETKIDLFTEMNRGAVILVDTAKEFLKENSSTFGRLFISLVLQAVLERAAITPAKRKPTFIYVDEAGSFFSSNIDDFLTEARKYSAGLILAHQYLNQCVGSLQSSLAANTGIKFASGLSAADARFMAPDMRTTPDFILDQPRLQFAAHIRNVTPHAVSIPIAFAPKLPVLPDLSFEKLIDRNRERVSVRARDVHVDGGSATATEPSNVVHRPLPPPDEDISREW